MADQNVLLTTITISHNFNFTNIMLLSNGIVRSWSKNRLFILGGGRSTEICLQITGTTVGKPTQVSN